MFQEQITIFRELIQPYVNPWLKRKGNVYHFSLIVVMASLHVIDYLAKMQLDIYGANIWPAAQNLSDETKYGTTPAYTLSDVMCGIDYPPQGRQEELYRDLLWTIGHTIGAQLFLFTIDKIRRSLGHVLGEKVKRELRKDIDDDWLSEKEKIYASGIQPPQHIHQGDVATFVDGTIKQANEFAANMTGFISGFGKLWTYSSGYAVLMVTSVSVIKSIVQYRFYDKYKKIINEWNKNDREYTDSIAHIHENARSIALLGGEQLERKRLEKYVKRNEKMAPGFVMMETVGFLGMQMLNIAGEVSAFYIGAHKLYSEHGTDPTDLMRLPKYAREVSAFFGDYEKMFLGMVKIGGAAEKIRELQNEIMERRSGVSLMERKFDDPKVELMVIENLSVWLPPKQKGQDTRTLIKEANIELKKGHAYLVQGDSGSGKSTWLHTLAGIWRHAKGTIRFAPGVSRHFTPQRAYIPEGATLWEALAYPKTIEERKKQWKELGGDWEEEVEEYLKLFNLKKLKSKDPKTLSGGELQRLGMIGGLCSGADIIFFDEPTTGSHATMKKKITEVICKKAKDGRTTVVVVEHFSKHDSAIKDLFDEYLLLSKKQLMLQEKVPSPKTPRKKFEVKVPVQTPIQEESSSPETPSLEGVKIFDRASPSPPETPGQRSHQGRRSCPPSRQGSRASSPPRPGTVTSLEASDLLSSLKKLPALHPVSGKEGSGASLSPPSATRILDGLLSGPSSSLTGSPESHTSAFNPVIPQKVRRLPLSPPPSRQESRASSSTPSSIHILDGPSLPSAIRTLDGSSLGLSLSLMGSPESHISAFNPVMPQKLSCPPLPHSASGQEGGASSSPPSGTRTLDGPSSDPSSSPAGSPPPVLRSRSAYNLNNSQKLSCPPLSHPASGQKSGASSSPPPGTPTLEKTSTPSSRLTISQQAGPLLSPPLASGRESGADSWSLPIPVNEHDQESSLSPITSPTSTPSQPRSSLPFSRKNDDIDRSEGVSERQ